MAMIEVPRKMVRRRPSGFPTKMQATGPRFVSVYSDQEGHVHTAEAT